MALTAVVLAGGPRDAVAAPYPSAPNKAFVPIAGVPLVSRTITALQGARGVRRVVVVAPFVAHALGALAGADEIRRDGPRVGDSLWAGLRDLPGDEPVLVATSDLPILTPEAVDEFLALAAERDADLTYACVERATHVARFPEVPHTWATLREGTYCGAGCVRIRPRVLPALDAFLDRLGAARKNPFALARIFGTDVLVRYALGRAGFKAHALGIADVERRASALLGCPAAAAACTHPEIAVNVDRPSDVALAERLVAARTLTSSG